MELHLTGTHTCTHFPQVILCFTHCTLLAIAVGQELRSNFVKKIVVPETISIA